MPASPDLAFLFDEGSGTATTDEIEALAGTLQTGCTFGRLGIDVTGSGYVNAPRASDSPFLGAITLVWIGEFDSVAPYQALLNKHAGAGGTQNPFDFRVAGGSVQLVRAHDTDYKVYTGGTVTTGVRTVVGVVCNGGMSDGATIYIDGSAVTTGETGTAGGSPTGSGADLRIGRRADGSTQLDGTVEAVLLWGEALSAGDMADIADDPYSWLGAGATHRISILTTNLLPDDSGDVYPQRYTVAGLANFVWQHAVWAFANSGTRIGFSDTFTVPQNYGGSAALVLIWSTAVTSGDVVWDCDYRAVGGDDAESLDQATAQESVTQTDTAPSASHERMVCTIPLTSTNLAAGDTVEYRLFRDGADASDTLGGTVYLVHAYVQYEAA